MVYIFYKSLPRGAVFNFVYGECVFERISVLVLGEAYTALTNP